MNKSSDERAEALVLSDILIGRFWAYVDVRGAAECPEPGCGGLLEKRENRVEKPEVRHTKYTALDGEEVCTGNCEGCEFERRLAYKAAIRPDEKVDHPSWYGGKDDPYETIKVLKAWLGRLGFEPYLAALYFNAVKYLSRAGVKGDLLEDLKKARWYLDEMITTIEGWKK